MSKPYNGETSRDLRKTKLTAIKIKNSNAESDSNKYDFIYNKEKSIVVELHYL